MQKIKVAESLPFTGNEVYGNGVNKGNTIIYVYILFKIIVDNSI